MRPWEAGVVAAVVVALVVGALLLYPSGPGAPGTTSSSGYASSSTSAPSSNGLQLRLALNASTLAPGSPLGISVSEFNTRSTTNNVTKAGLWAVQGLSLGACDTEGYSVYPFGVAVYQGRYTGANLSQATPLEVYPVVPCPMLLRLVTGYLFQPTSDLAVILPSASNGTTLLQPMSANVTVRGTYPASPLANATLQPLSPGVYTVAAGDEWGTLATLQFSVSGGQSSSSSSTSESGMKGVLSALVTIGPIAPVCSANATAGPAPQSFSSVQAVIVPPSGSNTTLAVNWTSDGCNVSGRFQAFLAPGSYQLDLSNCTFLGCRTNLPENFTINPGQQTTLSVSIDTGIR